MRPSRKSFLLGSVAAAGSLVTGALAEDNPAGKNKPSRPNVVVYLADQFRWDFVGANGRNSSTRTPSLDALAARGTNFAYAITNQPLCAPSRSVMMSSRYASETGVWKNGLRLDPGLPTLAGEFKKAGYTANYIGKWHLAGDEESEGGGPGYVKPERRGGFDDLWEGSNNLEVTSHPYEGQIWDQDGKPIAFKNQYRVDFLTDRVERFLRLKHDKPFFLFISQLEPHQQNDMNRIVGPDGSIERYYNAAAPPDLWEFPGDWRQQLPDYYGACESIDTSVGRVRKILEEEHLADNTIFVFVSDHGCHFMTRNEEYKRSPHNSSVRVPFLIEGPGIEPGRQVTELVGLINLAPTLLDAAGLGSPSSWRGHSLLPLAKDSEDRAKWPNQELIQISESMTGRTLRTKDWTYSVVEPSGDGDNPSSNHYLEHQLYDQRVDPNELVNLAGRKEYRGRAAELREILKRLIVASGEPEPEITPAPLYP